MYYVLLEWKITPTINFLDEGFAIFHSYTLHPSFTLSVCDFMHNSFHSMFQFNILKCSTLADLANQNFTVPCSNWCMFCSVVILHGILKRFTLNHVSGWNAIGYSNSDQVQTKRSRYLEYKCIVRYAKFRFLHYVRKQMAKRMLSAPFWTKNFKVYYGVNKISNNWLQFCRT